MIQIYQFDALKPEEILNRDIRAEADVEAAVDAIIADVRARGDAALKDYALKFDGAALESVQVSQQEIDEAFAASDPEFLKTLEMAAANIRAFHEQQVHKNFVMNDTPGIVLGQKYTPIERAGVYPTTEQTLSANRHQWLRKMLRPFIFPRQRTTTPFPFRYNCNTLMRTI